MNEFSLSYWCDKKRHTKKIKAKNNEKFYEKNSSRTQCIFSGITYFNHGIIDQIEREINFMDRTGLVVSGNRSPIRGLMHKYDTYSRYKNLENGNWFFNPYCFGGGENKCSFDHSTAWRLQGERWPVIVLTEPYHINEDEIKACEEVEEKTGYRFKIYPPSKKSLWNKDSFMVFWWHKDFYEPDFDILMG